MEAIKQKDIAKSTGVSEYMVTLVKKEESKTSNIPLAIAVAQMTGKRPIDYISIKMRKLALTVNPSLNRKVKPLSLMGK